VKKSGNWTTDEALVRGPIVEYDMAAAGLSAAASLGLLDRSEYERLMAMPKRARQVAIGKAYRRDPDFGDAVERGIASSVSKLLAVNGIADGDLVSLKRDAVFTTVECRTLELGEFVRFVEKGRYTTFARAGDSEVYFSSDDGGYAVKGIPDDRVALHEGFMLDLIFRVLRSSEQEDRGVTLRLARRIHAEYVGAELPVGNYREFNAESQFRLEESVGPYNLMVEDVDDLEHVDHRYNLTRVLIPLFGAALSV
jgi:hypothetical protein